jgi:TolA-binding protein
MRFILLCWLAFAVSASAQTTSPPTAQPQQAAAPVAGLAQASAHPDDQVSKMQFDINNLRSMLATMESQTGNIRDAADMQLRLDQMKAKR